MDRRELSLIIVALLLAICTPPALAEIYQWKDASGRTHFGDRRATHGSPQDATPVAEQKQRAADTRLAITIEADARDLSPAARARVETGVQRIFDVYAGLFRLDLRRPVTVDIHLFGSEAEMAAWAASIDRKLALPPGLLGVYITGHNVIGAWRHSDDESLVVGTLLHEASHVLVSQLAPNAPAWLQEGLAQYFEGLDPAADDIVVLPPPDAAAAIDWFVANRKLVTLRDYFSLDEARWRHLAHVEKNPIPYTVAWSVTYFLMSRPVGRQIVIELLQDLEKAKQAPTADTINRRYPGGYTMMEYDWFKWAQLPKTPQTLRW